MQNDNASYPTRQNYLDFDLEIESGSGRDYPVAVIRSPAGEARETMHFPFDELALENRLKDLQIALLRSGGQRRKVLLPEERTVQEFGRALFDTLLTGEVRSCYDVSQREAAGQNKGLRLKLRILPPELAALPWEFLYDSRQAEYVCLSRSTPVIRYLELPQPVQPLTVTLPLHILGMIASPDDLPRLDVTREKQRVEKAIKDLRTHGLVELTWLDGQTWRDLQRAMRSGSWHIFHFIGHGGFDRSADEGLVALADEQRQSYCLNATQLGRLLADHRSLRMVLLNACERARSSQRDVFSSTASILVRRGIPAVLAMQYEITDRAAIEFSRAFYEALAEGMPVDAALAEARKAVSLEVTNTVEWGTPVLYMRSPDGVLFNLPLTGKPAALSEQLREAASRKQQEAKWLDQERRKSEAREKAARNEAEHQAKLVAEKAHAERLEQERQERVAREKVAKEEADRKAHEEAAQRETERLRQYRAAQAAAEREARLKVISSQSEPVAEPLTAHVPQPTRWTRPRLPRWALPVAGGVLVVLVLTVIAWLVGSTIYSNAANSAATQTAVAAARRPAQTGTPSFVPQTPTITPSPTPLPTDTLTPTPPTVTRTSTITPSPTPTLGIGSTRIAETDSMVMVYVPAGEFLMGSSDEDNQAGSNEKPQHKVYVDEFWIDQTEVTNAQYQKCVQAQKCKASLFANDPQFNSGDQPTVGVSWDDAKTYCEWAGRQLPTEAQWEKAARGTDGRIYPWGNNSLAGNLLNFCDKNCAYNWKDSAINDGYANTAPWGKYPDGKSPYGAFDMAGNAWEWTQDWYQIYPGGEPSDNFGEKFKAIRGGSWYSTARSVRSANRDGFSPMYRVSYVGFRCAG